MCEECAKNNAFVPGATGKVYARMYGGPADGSITIVTRAFAEVRLPVMGGGQYVYTWAKGPAGSEYANADVLVCPGAMRLARE